MINYTPPTRHTSLFYHSREEYLDIVLPYFAAGLENNEFCQWNLPDDFKAEDAQRVLEVYAGQMNIHIGKAQFSIKSHDSFYLKDGLFSASRVLESFIELEKRALEKGFKGVRTVGDGTWALGKDWLGLLLYENEVNRVIQEHKIRALCSYFVPRMDLKDICDIGTAHQSSLVKQLGNWSRLDGSKFVQADIY